LQQLEKPDTKVPGFFALGINAHNFNRHETGRHHATARLFGCL
jgi:hypothetical protein